MEEEESRPVRTPAQLKTADLADLIHIVDERYADLKAQLDGLPTITGELINLPVACWNLEIAVEILRQRVNYAFRG